MMNENISYSKLLLVFFGSLAIAFVFLYFVVNPMVQDSYNKGYQRGINESCPDLMEFCNQEKQVPSFVVFPEVNVSIS